MSNNYITINDNNYAYTPGETILEVAQRNNIFIPTMCYLKGTTPTGACRLCIVEVEKVRGLVTSCTTPAQDNMIIKTESKKVLQSRKKTLELMASSGNHNCTICSTSQEDWTDFRMKIYQNDATEDICPVQGECKLQEFAYKYQVSPEHFSSRTDTVYPTETVNPFIVRDFSRCIHCGRCVQACNEVQVNNAISIGYRGVNSKIVAAGDSSLAESDCVFCGECVQACPVGALVEKSTRYQVRPWETDKIRTTCSYCGVGCQLYLHVKNKEVVKVTGVEDAAPNFGSLCVKGRFGYNFINSPDRLTSPLMRKNGELKEASWDEALDFVADKFQEIKNDTNSKGLAVLASARITNEDNYVAQKFSRAVLKTNSIDHCARL